MLFVVRNVRVSNISVVASSATSRQQSSSIIFERRQTSLQSISSKLDAEIKLQLRGGKGTTCVLDFGVNCPFKHADV